MKKLLSLLLLMLYLFGSTDAYQLLKIPTLIEHFNLHKTANKQLSIADFLLIHYNGCIVYDDDYDKDMQLPFKTLENELSLSVNAIPPEPVRVVVNNILIYNDKYPAFEKASYSVSLADAIFQPPRSIG